MKKRYSVSAIVLIILLAIRFTSNGYFFLLSLFDYMDIFSIIYIGTVGLLTLFYGIALIGIIRKTQRGLDFVIAIAMLDIIFTFILAFMLGTLGNLSSLSAMVVDVILIALAGNIYKRNPRSRKKK